jgi:hypothetical protein
VQKITVIKQDLTGAETWRYVGEILERGEGEITIEARFNKEDTPFYEISLLRGDRFVETYYEDRWYNIFEIHDREDDRLKGWYCNIAFPAVITENAVSYIDLALDLLVYPDGGRVVLDEDEFNALPLPAEIRQKARQALAQLQRQFEKSIQADRRQDPKIRPT